MVNAVLPLYLTAQVGLGLLAYGFVDGLYQGVSALVRLLGGWAGDRLGRPKWVAAAGYAVSAASRLALVPVHGLTGISAVITADRLGKGLRTAPRDSMISAASAPTALGRAFGVHRALDTVGAAIGPLLAFGLLAWAVGSAPVTAGDWSAVFVVSFAFAVVGVAILVLFVPDLRTATGPTPAGAARVSLRAALGRVTSAPLRRPLLAAGVLGLVTIGDGFIYLTLQQRSDLAAAYFPLLYVGTNVVYLSLAVPLGRLADRVGRARVLLGGHVALLTVYLAAAAPLPGVASIAVCLALLGTFYAATDGVLPALVSRLIPADVRGSGIAAAQTVVAAARFAASVLFGAAWMALGNTPALVVLACALAVALPAARWLLRGADAAVTR
jgi:MFS family permease